MTQADDPFLIVHAYCDGELDPANALAFERRMAADPRLAAERDRIQALKRAMARLKPAAMPPTALRSRVEQAVGLRRRAVRPTWSALAASVGLAVILSTVATWSVLAPGRAGLVEDEVVGSHIRALMGAQPFDIASSDRHTVKPWFNGRIPEAPRVIDLANAGFALVGGRIDVIGRAPVATLVYRHRQHLISLTAVPGGRATATAVYRQLSSARICREKMETVGIEPTSTTAQGTASTSVAGTLISSLTRLAGGVVRDQPSEMSPESARADLTR